MANFSISSFPFRPLTTAYSRPPLCNGIYLPRNIWVMDDDPTCLPPGFDTESTSFFSPGVACPSGYWSACSDSKGVSTITTVTCCPTYRSDISLSCVDPATLSGMWRDQFCTFKARWTGAVVTVTLSNEAKPSTRTTTFTSPQGINAFGVRMVYQTTDISPITTEPPITTSLSTGQLDVVNTSSAPDSSPPPASSSSSLSTGAIVAISVLVPLFGILVGLEFFLWWRKRAALAISSQPGHPPPGGQTSESPGYGVSHSQQTGYQQQTHLYDGATYVLPPQYETYPKEMPSAYSVAAEMPVTGNGHAELPATYPTGPQELSTTTRQDRE
ncbi:hypothetical protein QBC40DRAFT_280452 [Triangularia verruculosa]|uniref:Uncharacterized protein n=1 Tax=Triangularia verruculosa TaxID=2587418 RepID=A0AAN7AUU4_9PEZI|nr:hypothetical protein QBC40DRAFT_280452 [Triangularia verruculosa]